MKNLKRLEQELRDELRGNILEEYNNKEYWSKGIVEDFRYYNHLTQYEYEKLCKWLGL